jgi:hypothetical protein
MSARLYAAAAAVGAPPGFGASVVAGARAGSGVGGRRGRPDVARHVSGIHRILNPESLCLELNGFV